MYRCTSTKMTEKTFIHSQEKRIRSNLLQGKMKKEWDEVHTTLLFTREMKLGSHIHGYILGCEVGLEKKEAAGLPIG
jgi:hypothetical protein